MKSPRSRLFALLLTGLVISLFTPAPTALGAGDWVAVDLAGSLGLLVKGGTQGHMCVADADSDGLSDVVLSRHGGDLWPLMQQNPDGTFTQDYLFGPKNDRHSCTVGDYAGIAADGGYGPPDGLPDFYTTNGACHGTCTKAYPNNLYIQRPDGTFQDAAAAFGVDDPHGRGREAVTLDENNDGLDDLFLTNEISSTFLTSNRVFDNTGPGFVERVDPAATLSLASKCARAVDFNDDGRTDVVVCTPTRTYLLANTPTGFVDVRASFGLTATQAYRDVAVADFDGDGHADLAGIQATKFTVRLWRPTQTPWSTISYTLKLSQGRAIAVGDMFGTGLTRDVYVVDGWVSGTSLQKPDWVLRWTGTSTAATFQTYQVPAPPQSNSSNPLDGQGDSVAMVPDWAGTGRDLAVVSNGAFTSGYYQAIHMQQTVTP